MIVGRTEEMLLHFLISLTLSVAVQAASALGRYATIVQARDMTNTSAYDFVVAGGGIAGLTVADRLTEDPNGRHIHRIAECSLAQAQL